MEKELTAAVTTQEPMLADSLIVVQQLPVIKEQLHSIKAQAQASVAESLALVCTEETLKVVKEQRAKLNRDRKDLDDRRAVVKKQIIKRLAEERPTLRFGCCRWLAPPLLAAGVPERQIDVLEPRTMYGYGLCNVIPFMLTHNVPNCGYKVHFPSGKVIYATDTNNLNGVQALGYDLYLIEANYRDEDIQAKIAEKKAAGQYAYEMQVLKNHLSEAKCNDFLVRNMQANSVYIPMHVHVDKEKTDGRNGEN